MKCVSLTKKAKHSNQRDECDRLILPGVGSFDAGMKNLEEKSLINCLKKEVSEGKSILGICLGMQLLGRKSEEGSSLGLGFIPFDTVKFSFDKTLKLKIPHIGLGYSYFYTGK